MGPKRKTIQKGGNLAPSLKLTSGGNTSSISNMSSFFITFSQLIMVIILGCVVWILYLIQKNMRKEDKSVTPSTQASSYMLFSSSGIGSRHDPFEDPYQPPLKNDGMYFPKDSSDTRGVPLLHQPILASTCNSSNCIRSSGTMEESNGSGWPINMKSRGFAPEFRQLGILSYERSKTSNDSLHDNMILPLFGRRVMNGRDKYQYYTLSNTGSVNTKLPVLLNGRNCIGEYGCDEISNGDTVYVQGYNNIFKATVYENSLFSYIPFLY